MTTMTTKARLLVGIVVVAGILAIGVGLAAAGDGPTPGAVMMGPGNGMGSGSMLGGAMGAGMATMMSGVDMDAMHEQMMAALAGKIPADQLARCDELHDQMWSDAGMDEAQGTGHSGHHGSGSTG